MDGEDEEAHRAPPRPVRADPFALIPVAAMHDDDLREEIRSSHDFPCTHVSQDAARTLGSIPEAGRKLLSSSSSAAASEEILSRVANAHKRSLLGLVTQAVSENAEPMPEFLSPLPPPLTQRQFDREPIVRAARASLRSAANLPVLTEKLDMQGWGKTAHALLSSPRDECQYCLFVESTAFAKQALCLVVGYRCSAPTTLVSHSWFLAPASLQ